MGGQTMKNCWLYLFAFLLTPLHIFTVYRGITASGLMQQTQQPQAQMLLYRQYDTSHAELSSKLVLRAPDSGSSEIILKENTPGTEITTDASWSAKTQAIIYATDSGVYVISARQPKPQEILKSTESSIYESPSWSPDGENFVAIHIEPRSNDPKNPDVFFSITLSDLQGNSRTILGPFGQSHEFLFNGVYWSPDGKYLAVDGNPGSPNSPPLAESPSIYLVPTTCFEISGSPCRLEELKITDGSGVRTTYQLPDRSIHPEHWGRPSWSPDGRQLAFWCEPTLCMISIDGTRFRRLKTQHVEIAVSWSPDGRYLAHEDDTDIYLLNLINNSDVRLTHFQDPHSVTPPIWITLPAGDFLLENVLSAF